MNLEPTLRPAEPGVPVKRPGVRKQGYTAASRGDSRDTCPYRQGAKRTAWLSGWWHFTQGRPLAVSSGSYESDKKRRPQESMSKRTAAMFRGMKRNAA